MADLRLRRPGTRPRRREHVLRPDRNLPRRPDDLHVILHLEVLDPSSHRQHCGWRSVGGRVLLVPRMSSSSSLFHLASPIQYDRLTDTAW